MTDDDINEEIRTRVAAELEERARRRQQMRRVRAEMQRNRIYAKDKINEEKARRP